VNAVNKIKRFATFLPLLFLRALYPGTSRLCLDIVRSTVSGDHVHEPGWAPQATKDYAYYSQRALAHVEVVSRRILEFMTNSGAGVAGSSSSITDPQVNKRLTITPRPIHALGSVGVF